MTMIECTRNAIVFILFDRTNPLYEAGQREREVHHFGDSQEEEDVEREEAVSPGATTTSSSSGYASHGKEEHGNITP